MSSYVFPIQTAFIIFVIASMFLLVPWLIYGYRKDGFFSWSRFAVSFSLFSSSWPPLPGDPAASRDSK